MAVLVGKVAPDFTASAVMPDNSVKEFNLYTETKSKKCILFFYPLNFTFVCPSEILAFNEQVAAFKERNTLLIGVSIDSHWSHIAYKAVAVKEGGIGQVSFPLVSDLNKNISRSYDVLHNDSIAYRGLFLIDENHQVRHQLVNDLPFGRNVDEAVRMVDALDFHKEFGEVCPANWKRGEQGMKPTREGVKSYLSNKVSNS